VGRDDVLGQPFFELGDGQWDIPELRDLFSLVVPKTQAVVGYEVQHEFPGIGQRTYLVDARRLVHPDDNSTSILVLFDDVTERQRRDLEKDIILSETRHRMRNLFAVIRSLSMQIKVDGLTGSQYRDRFLARLEGTLRAQEISAASEPVELEDLIQRAVGDIAGTRVVFSGPPVIIEQGEIVALSMMFHELSTNSAKYGALSTSEGKISVSWSLESSAPDNGCMRCVWQEEHGPAVSPPQHKGFGTQLMHRMASHLGGSLELDYRPNGLEAVINFPSKPV